MGVRTDDDRIVDAFVEAGEIAHDTGLLPDALEALAVRLDLAGAGDLLRTITNEVCWAPHEGVCPRCGWSAKQPPQPHPRPPQPPPPPPPPPPQR